MKRNKHIEKQFGRTIILGIVVLILGIVLIGIQAYAFFKSGYYNIAIFTSIILLMIISKFLKSRIELILLNRMRNSKEFGNLIKLFEFKQVDTNLYKTNLNGYFVTMDNHINPKIKSDGRMNDLFLDLFCDCSELNPKEINEIEDEDFIVTHHSIRKFSSNWLIRFNPNKISNTLNQQLELAKKYQLKIIDEEELKKKEYWV